jgi:uncharacterized protein (TIGR00297 family)
MNALFPFSPNLFGDVLVGVAVSFVLLTVAWKLKFITRGAYVIGLMMGVVTYAAFGWPGLVMFAAYFVLSDLATRHAINVLIRKKRSIAESKEGPMKFGAVFVPGAIPLLAGFVMIFSDLPANRFFALLAFVTALATALGDLVSTDLGQAYGQRTYQLITLDRVRPGTRGGVSIEGSVYGAIVIVLFCLLSFALFHVAGFSVGRHGLFLGGKALVIVIFAAALGNNIESVFSGILGQYQRHPNKMVLNFLGSVIGALLAVFFTNLPEG